MKCQWIKLTFSLIPQHQYPRHRMERQGHILLCIYFRFIQPLLNPRSQRDPQSQGQQLDPLRLSMLMVLKLRIAIKLISPLSQLPTLLLPRDSQKSDREPEHRAMSEHYFYLLRAITLHPKGGKPALEQNLYIEIELERGEVKIGLYGICSFHTGY